MAETQSAEDTLIGVVLDGKYRVEQPLARGAMGKVYSGKQIRLGRDVAIKFMDPKNGIDESSAEMFEKRFFREASSSAALNHPNTIIIHDYGEFSGLYYLVMELLDGVTLREFVRKNGPLSAPVASHIGKQIASSLADAHDVGLVHRDLKPANIMLLTRGGDEHFVKVLDFGTAKTETEDNDLTETGAMVGTPRYMSPEQITGDTVSPASDIYSFGATLYFMLTAKPPFDRKTRYSLFKAHVGDPPPSFSETNTRSTQHAGLEALTMSCLEKSPDARPRSMAELIEVLADEASGIKWKPPKRRRSSPLAMVATLAFLGIAASAAFWIWFTRSPVSTKSPGVSVIAVDAKNVPGSKSAEKTTSHVQIRSTPIGARIVMNGKDLGDTPMQVALQEPSDIVVSRSGFETRTIRLSMTQKDVDISLVPLPVEPTTAKPGGKNKPRPQRNNDLRNPWR